MPFDDDYAILEKHGDSGRMTFGAASWVRCEWLIGSGIVAASDGKTK